MIHHGTATGTSSLPPHWKDTGPRNPKIGDRSECPHYVRELRVREIRLFVNRSLVLRPLDRDYWRIKQIPPTAEATGEEKGKGPFCTSRSGGGFGDLVSFSLTRRDIRL
jgi:hypothetical protein